MTSALCSQFVSEQSPESAIHHDINVLRDLHPSDIAEHLENTDLKPEVIIEILLQIGNHIAMSSTSNVLCPGCSGTDSAGWPFCCSLLCSRPPSWK
jgi:hypothetical protein